MSEILAVSECLPETCIAYSCPSLWLKRNVVFIGASSLCEKRGQKALYIKEVWVWSAKSLFNEDQIPWDGEKLLNLWWHFKGFSALPLQQLSVKAWLSLSTDCETGETRNMGKISCRRKEGNCSPCAFWLGLKAVGINYIQVIWGSVGFTQRYLLSQGGIQLSPAGMSIPSLIIHLLYCQLIGMSRLILWQV